MWMRFDNEIFQPSFSLAFNDELYRDQARKIDPEWDEAEPNKDLAWKKLAAKMKAVEKGFSDRLAKIAAKRPTEPPPPPPAFGVVMFGRRDRPWIYKEWLVMPGQHPIMLPTTGDQALTDWFKHLSQCWHTTVRRVFQASPVDEVAFVSVSWSAPNNSISGRWRGETVEQVKARLERWSRPPAPSENWQQKARAQLEQLMERYGAQRGRRASWTPSTA